MSLFPLFLHFNIYFSFPLSPSLPGVCVVVSVHSVSIASPGVCVVYEFFTGLSCIIDQLGYNVV